MSFLANILGSQTASLSSERTGGVYVDTNGWLNTDKIFLVVKTAVDRFGECFSPGLFPVIAFSRFDGFLDPVVCVSFCCMILLVPCSVQPLCFLASFFSDICKTLSARDAYFRYHSADITGHLVTFALSRLESYDLFSISNGGQVEKLTLRWYITSHRWHPLTFPSCY